MKYTLKEVKDFIDQLQELYPIAFPKKPNCKVPLKIGINKDIIKNLNADYQLVNYALHLWCMGRRYNLVCSILGMPRLNLTGQVVGHIKMKDAEYALNKLGVTF